MKFTHENKLLAAFNYTSLTDVVLQLLIFFLLSSSFVVAPGIKVQVPKAVTGETGSEVSITISLTERGELFLNADRVTVQDLGHKLAGLLDKARDRIVVVRADKNVTLQNTVEVIDIAKSVGATRFMIATEPVTVQ
jgi:biopolymer transport protein ExbD